MKKKCKLVLLFVGGRDLTSQELEEVFDHIEVCRECAEKFDHRLLAEVNAYNIQCAVENRTPGLDHPVMQRLQKRADQLWDQASPLTKKKIRQKIKES